MASLILPDDVLSENECVQEESVCAVFDLFATVHLLWVIPSSIP